MGWRIGKCSLVTVHAEAEGAEKDNLTLRAIGPSTPVALGLIISIIAGVWVVSWKLSNFSTKLDQIISREDQASAKWSQLEAQFYSHEKSDEKMWLELRSQVTSMQLNGTDKAKELEKRLMDLENKNTVRDMLQRMPVKSP